MDKIKEIERSIITTYRSRLWSKFTKAINEYKLVKEGDKIQLRLWNNAEANYEVRYSGTWLTIEVVE